MYNNHPHKEQTRSGIPSSESDSSHVVYAVDKSGRRQREEQCIYNGGSSIGNGEQIFDDDDDDDDGMSLENSVFDESMPLPASHVALASDGVLLKGRARTPLGATTLVVGKPTVTNDLCIQQNQSSSTRRANRSSSDSNKSQTTMDTGYMSTGSERNPSEFRSRFSSVDTESSMDSCLTEKTIDSPLSKESFKIEPSSAMAATMHEYNSINNNINTGCYSNGTTTPTNNNSSVLTSLTRGKMLPAVPVRKQYSLPPKMSQSASPQQLSNGIAQPASVSTSASSSSAASAASSGSTASSSSAAAGGVRMGLGLANSLDDAAATNRSVIPPPPASQRPIPPKPPNRSHSAATQLPNNNKFSPVITTEDIIQKPPPIIAIRNKLNKHRPPPIVYPKLHQRQDSSLSSDSYSMTSSPGYNSKSNIMEAPLLQNASKINKTAVSVRHHDANDGFGITSASRFNGVPPPRSKINYRQDSSVSSDSFSQTSSPGYNTKMMEAPLLPSMKRLCNVPAPVVGKQKFQNETIEELEQTVPTSPITKSVSTPASLQTIVRFQNGSSNMSLQHRIINRRKSSNPYVTNGRLKFRLFQILINAFALLAIAGGLAAYFNAYPTIKFVNKTIINTIRVEEVSTFGKNPAPGTCLPIIVKFCQGPHIPYNYTVFPNYIGHFGQLETQVDLDAYAALVDVRCYELVSLFLCTLFVPKCGSTGSTVPPCKTLCTETMRRCGFFFDVFGLSLPDYLNCNLFKDFDNAEECVGLMQVRDVIIAASNPVCHGFLCDQARCIPNDYVCDGHLDCMDQMDESNCGRCDEESIYCGEERCMGLDHVCDGIVDCPYGQDERNCVRLSDHNGDLGKGILQVFRMRTQEWTPACVKNWDRSVSPTAVCSMLGYSSVNATSVVTQRTHRPLLTSVNVSTDIWKMYAKKRSNLMKEFASCKRDEDYPIAELTCANYECGKVRKQKFKPARRIIGGSTANPGAWPFLAAILGGPERIFYCAGVLISDQWVLTASHCIGNHTVIDLEDWTIQLGVTRRNSYTYSGERVKVRMVIPHPLYNMQIAHDNDIALFQLAKRVSFHEHLLPVCLPPPNMKQLKPGELCTVVGWGKREDKDPKSTYEPIVNEVQVPVIRRQQCDEWLDNLTVSDGMICAGYEEGGKDACQGDSGGPLLCPYPGEKDKWFVGGIVSWGIMCAHPKLPGVYANVIKYIPWIVEQMQKNSKPHRIQDEMSNSSGGRGGGGGANKLNNNNTSNKRRSNVYNNKSPSDNDYYNSYEKRH